MEKEPDAPVQYSWELTRTGRKKLATERDVVRQFCFAIMVEYFHDVEIEFDEMSIKVHEAANKMLEELKRIRPQYDRKKAYAYLTGIMEDIGQKRNTLFFGYKMDKNWWGSASSICYVRRYFRENFTSPDQVKN